MAAALKIVTDCPTSPALQIDPIVTGGETDARCCASGNSTGARREFVDECGQESPYALLLMTDIAVLAVNGRRVSGMFIKDILVSVNRSLCQLERRHGVSKTEISELL